LKFLKNILLALTALICFLGKTRAQCITLSTFADYNCVSAVCELTLALTTSAPGPYTVSSSPAGINTVIAFGNTVAITNIPFQPSYNITVTASGNCTGFTQVLYTNPNLPANISVTTLTAVSCFSGSNAAVSAAFGGTAPFTWLWSTGGTSSTISGIGAGVYSVTITDSKSCSATKQFTVTEPGEIGSTFATTFIPCYGGTVTSAITTTGGLSPFNYTLNGLPVQGNTVTGLSTGVYTIFTKDNKACTHTSTVTVSQQVQQVISPTVQSPSCPGKSDGGINISVSGGVAGYSYTWHPGISNSATIANIPAGNYTVLVGDASSCITKSVITVQPASAIAPIPAIQKENCSAADGAFTLNISGGYPPYNQVTLPVNSTGTVVGGLSTGSYTSIITDTHGCIDSIRFYIGNLSPVTLNIVQLSSVNCYNQCSGSIQLNVHNAQQPVTYSATGTPTTTSAMISNLCAGFYVVRAIDAIGCPAFDTINFLTPPVFTYSAASPPPVCIGKQVTLTSTASGGTGGHTYIWNPGSIHGATINVEPGATTVYSLNVYDSKGCTLAPYQITVNVNPPISINVNNSNTGICPGTTAQITPTVSGGDGNYTYSWLPGGNKNSSIFVENITVPAYSLYVNDGCGSPTGIKIINIKLHPVIIPTFSTKGKGGCLPYCTSFTNTTPRSTHAIWNYGDKPSEQAGDSTFYCYAKSGSYNIRLSVTDSNSCKTSFTYSDVIKVLASPDAKFITDPLIVTLNDAENVLIKNLSSNGDSFKWYVNNELLGEREDAYYTFPDTGCYDIKLIVSNGNHCVDSALRSMCVFEGFNFYMPRAFTPNNDGLNDVLLPKGTGWLEDNYALEIYNRWGHRIFRTDEVNKGWDGGVKTDPLGFEITSSNPNDVYRWKVFVTDNMQKEHILSGYVTLLR
jgi:gliding motility-associated-like protein